MNEQRVHEILQNKKNSGDFVFKNILTPPIYSLIGDIIEARGTREGNISILSFCDTADKKVITMKHLNYDYVYMPYQLSWGNNVFASDLDFSELIKLGHFLKKKYVVWLVSISIDGRGYNETMGWDMRKDMPRDFIENGEDFVLFVFNL